MDAIRWAENSGRKLYPGQRFALKVANGLPLSDTDRIEFRDPLKQRAHSFTEKDYLSFLYDEGRSNVRVLAEVSAPVLLATGRRSGKTTLGSTMLTHAVHRVVAERLHVKYEVPEGSEVTVGLFGPTQSSNAFMFKDMKADLARRDGFLSHSSSRNRIEFSCDHGRIAIRSVSHVTGTRGWRYAFGFIDEMAYIPWDVFTAVIPCIFSNPGGHLVAASATAGRSGPFFEQFGLCQEHPENGVALRLPTWAMNPMIDPAWYESELQRCGEGAFRAEYGAEFVDLADEVGA